EGADPSPPGAFTRSSRGAPAGPGAERWAASSKLVGMAPPGGGAVELDRLVKRYGAATAVDGLSLSAARGAVTSLLGPNGAGKTTTIEICEGFRRADSGTVRVLGLDPV